MKALAAFALAFGLAAPALALGDETQRTARTGVEIRAWSPWPNQLNKGWAPMFVELQNQSADRHFVRLTARAQDWSNDRTIEEALELAPGESAHLELHGATNGMWNVNAYSLDVRVDEDRNVFSSVVASGAPREYRAVLAVGSRDVAASDVQRWIETVSTSHVNSGYFVGGTPAPAAKDDVQIGFATFAELPASSIAYTSLDLVVIDASEGLPGPRELGAMLAWVRGGGDLYLSGPRALEFARADAAIAPWLEPRFTRTDNAHHIACGLGRITIDDREGFLENEEVRQRTTALARANDGVVPRPTGGSRARVAAPVIPGIGEVPYRAFALLLIVFAVVIGPINFIWVRRMRRPVLLLVTIPAIAILTSGMLLAYGIFFQGLEVKTASNSIALLDQREHRSACVEHRMLYAGIAPGEGLRPQPGTSVHAIGYDVPGNVGVRERLNLAVRREDGLLLTSDYLPTRAPVVQVLCSERAERARLDVERDGENYAITSNLGTRVDRLVLRDARGDYFVLNGALDAGARGSVTPLETSSAITASLELMRSPVLISAELDAMPTGHALPPGTYVARLVSSPFRDDCGVESVELAGEHTLYAVLPLDLEAWR